MKKILTALALALGVVGLHAQTINGIPNQSITGPMPGLTTLAASGTITFTGIEASSGTACLQISTTGAVTNTGAACGSGGSTSPGGTTGAIQYNNGGVFGGLNGSGLLLSNGASAPTLVTTSAGIAGAISDETGTGSLVFATSPTLVTPALGTPSAVVLTNGTGLPLTTGVTGTLTVGHGGIGVATLTGIAKGNGTSAFTAAASSDIIGLWTGTCSSSTYLNGAGACATPSGSGTVNSGTATQIAYYAATGTAVSSDSLLTDSGTVLGYTGTGGFSGVSFSGTGATNGFVNLTTIGTLPTAPGTSTLQITVPSSVTAYAMEMPGAQPTAGNTFLSCTAANPSVCTWASAGSGVADTTATVSTTAIAANTCTAQTAITMTGLGTGMTIQFTPSTDFHTTTGWSASGQLYFYAYPTANTVNWYVCNPTTASITPGASTTWNVSAK